jgi:hypothetical protein
MTFFQYAYATIYHLFICSALLPFWDELILLLPFPPFITLFVHNERYNCFCPCRQTFNWNWGRKSSFLLPSSLLVFQRLPLAVMGLGSSNQHFLRRQLFGTFISSLMSSALQALHCLVPLLATEALMQAVNFPSLALLLTSILPILPVGSSFILCFTLSCCEDQIRYTCRVLNRFSQRTNICFCSMVFQTLKNINQV